MNRRRFLAAAAGAPFARAAASRLNVLFITVDDLRPQLGCYGDPVVKTPHIDRLAAGGTVFERAYCQMAVCSPSRTSFLTGRRPDSTRVLDFTTHFRSTIPDVVTLPQLFKQNSYQSHGVYKVFHLAGTAPRIGNMNDPESWSDELELPEKSVYGPRGQALLEQDLEAYKRDRAAGIIRPVRSLAIESPDVEDADLSDGEAALRAVDWLRRNGSRPFFLGVGFYKPHLPFVAPRKYWDLYRESDLRLPDNRYPPKGAPPYAVVDLGELHNFVDIPKTEPLPEELCRKLLHGYLASISYVDTQVGLLLDELDRQRLRDRTIVVLLGDNGYQLGEHGIWARKHTNFETSARVPLIVSAPGRKGSGHKSAAIVELLDVYPTLAEMCGLAAPGGLEGVSFMPVLDDPALPGKPGAYTQHPRGRRMGRSVVSRRYRYTEWAEAGKPPEAVELYDHETDPGENLNLAAFSPPADVMRRMPELLRSGGKP